jgi:transcriptional regulator with XRE-family HTH domain
MTFQQILDKSKLTQSQLATKMSVHQTTISNWKLKKVTPAIAQMQKLADALDVDLQTIVACFVQQDKKQQKTKKE